LTQPLGYVVSVLARGDDAGRETMGLKIWIEKEAVGAEIIAG
jgi:hypothetical protein